MTERVKLDKYIKRYETGWAVVVTRGGREQRRYFPDGPRGNKEASFRRAQACREAVLVELGPALTFKRRDVRSKTGVVGVSLERRLVKGRACWRYRAEWPSETGPVRRAFGVKKYGKRGAFEMAVAARREALAQLEAEGRSALVRELDRRRVPPATEQPAEDAGWLLRMRWGGRRQSTFFADRRYGGREAALQRALVRRRALAASLPPPLKGKLMLRYVTGVVGVCLEQHMRRPGRVLRYWRASWNELGGEHVRVRFSALEHGEQKARHLAINARGEAMKRLAAQRRAVSAAPPKRGDSSR